MPWVVERGYEFLPEFDDLPDETRIEILALSRLLQQFGPQLGRPRVDTLKGSRHSNMKELALAQQTVSGGWLLRSTRNAKQSLLVAGDKSGVSEKKFYQRLIAKADRRFDAHLNRLKEKE
jgi:hypothetical protein